MRERWRARVIEDVGNWQRDEAVIVLAEDRVTEIRYLMRDGTYASAEPFAYPEGEPGIVVPRGALQALHTAIGELLQGATHADTEARVLREWLAVETARVDEALGGR